MTRSHPGQDELPRIGGPGDCSRIVRVDESRRRDAIACLVARGGPRSEAHADRFIAFAATQRIDLDAMWAALDPGGLIEATVLAVPNPGRTAMLFASHPPLGELIPRVAAVIDRACTDLRDLPVDLAQVLLEPAERRDRAAYLSADFTELAMLGYMERSLRRLPEAPPPPPGITIEVFDETRVDDVRGILDRSYENTLDCPGLFGLRRTADILEGHRATGEHDPNLWFLLIDRGVAEGVLLFNPSASDRSIELVYLGLAAAVRGRGLGRWLLQSGLSRLRGRPETTVKLAVDEANAPALALYRAAGFRRTQRRVALVRPIRTVGAASGE